MSRYILVIDDDPDIRKSFLLAMKGSEYEVETAETGDEGVKKEREKRYDLIFLDIKMPGMNGVETLHEIRKRNRETPVYFITAFYEEYCNELQVLEGKGVEFDLLKKPIGIDSIIMVGKSVFEGPIAY